ncbi:hypothetical protein GCM10027589_47810 [Actinocorallia lasiicapitis]
MNELRAPIDRHESLGYQVNHLARLLEQALRVRIAEHGVVPGQFAQLLALYAEDGVTQNQLCERVRIDQSTMAHTLKRMERDGLIERTVDPADRRRSHITLTGRARDLQPVLTEAALDVNRQATRPLSEEESRTLLALLTRVITGLEAPPEGSASC